MKLSKRTRYGLRLMIELALNYNKGALNLNEIARREEISLKYLSQIIIPLKNSGFVHSIRGSSGGYILSKPPDEVTVYDIVTILEGEMDIVECINDPALCDRNTYCTARNVWSRLNQSIVSLLESITLKSLARETEMNFKKNVIVYHI
ncbi:MAG: Rrf2 family transcriptional regulator [Spirochaetales bacterium]|nr:Rrf2 family transcriptional regulator [Spirochaetales bacterium]